MEKKKSGKEEEEKNSENRGPLLLCQSTAEQQPTGTLTARANLLQVIWIKVFPTP